jgi:undecaprenyl-diphosphatase
MRDRAPIRLDPMAADLATARCAKRLVTPGLERELRAVTTLADERLIVALCSALWVASRCRTGNAEARRDADDLAVAAAVSSVLPHALKRLVDRERPDRRLVLIPRHGIRRSGKPWDSFPSGHALHLGMFAAALTRMAPRPWKSLVWPAAAALAATRILLLAHYPSDVAAGLAMGAGLDRVLRLRRQS